MKNINVALAGAGAFGLKHLDAIALIDDVRVVSLVSPDIEKTRTIAARYDIALQASGLKMRWPCRTLTP